MCNLLSIMDSVIGLYDLVIENLKQTTMDIQLQLNEGINDDKAQEHIIYLLHTLNEIMVKVKEMRGNYLSNGV